MKDRPRGVKLDGSALAGMASMAALRGDSQGWYYQGVDNILWVRFSDQGAPRKVQVEK
ncbi:MAG TPA: hypothetical protein VFL79_14490 [Terriglobia bacterium]|nr:hypothetical protein [Terriglobia bacterium]